MRAITSPRSHEEHEGRFEELSNRVIGCALEVHKTLGPGLLESSYEQALVYELTNSDIAVQRQLELPVRYKGMTLKGQYRVDLLIENQLIVELKSVDRLLDIHAAQLLTYLKLSGIKVGLLINFNQNFLKQGIKRFVLYFVPFVASWWVLNLIHGILN